MAPQRRQKNPLKTYIGSTPQFLEGDLTILDSDPTRSERSVGATRIRRRVVIATGLAFVAGIGSISLLFAKGEGNPAKEATPWIGSVQRVEVLPPPHLGETSLKEALQRRSSARVFDPKPLEVQTLSDLLWAADGVNRPKTGARTAPTAYDWRHMEVFVFQAGGVARYDATRHALEWLDSTDRRALTGMQDFVKTAPLNLVLVSDETKMDPKEPQAMRDIFTGVASGAIAQNVYLYCASVGLHVVVRGSVDRETLHRYLGLGAGQKIVVSQTIGTAP